MKTILALAFTVLTCAIVPAATQACDAVCRPVVCCAPVYVCTKELCRATECRWALTSCGTRYSYEVTVVTYADYYSDGSCQRYTRTYRC